MQPYGLTIDKFLDHAAQMVRRSRGRRGGCGRRRWRAIGYAELRDRANRLSGALAALGLKPGDRVGTLAWNTQHHLEIYYGAMGMGLVCHTLNPRLTVAQLAAMINEAEDRVLAVAADLLPLARELAPLCPGIEHVVVLDAPLRRRASAPHRARSGATRRCSPRMARLPTGAQFDENAPAGLCYTSGTTGQPKGVLYTHRSNYLHTLRALQADAVGADRARRAAARGADVPRQWLGPAVRRAGGGDQAGAAGAHARRRQPGAADARRGRDRRGRRADRVARAGRSSRRDRRATCPRSSAS